MRAPESPETEPHFPFIADLVGTLVKSYGVDSEEPQEEHSEMETVLIMTNAGSKMTH